MIIQNKKSGRQESVSPKEWERLNKLGFAKGWTIVSKEEAPPKKVIPKEIIDFKQLIKPTHGRKGKTTLPND